MAVNKRLLQGAAAAPGAITPSEHFGVVLYEGDGKSGRSVNGGKFGAGATFGIEKSTTQATDSRITTTYYAKNVGSISGWLKKNGNTSELEYVFVTKDDTGSAHQLGINLLQEGDSDLSARVGNGSSTTNVNTSGLTLNNDAWHHYVVTWNLPNGSNNVKVYVDGSLEATGSQSTGSWTGNSSRTFQLGHYTNTNTNNGFAGMQDQVRVFEKELSSSEVSTLYAETAETVTSLDPLSEDTTDTLQVLGDSSCIAAYQFENDETDLSGNHNGTGTEIQYGAGRYGQAASFNNTSGSKMVIGAMNSVIPNNTTGVSFSFWVYLDSVNTGADYDHWFVGQEDYGGAFSDGEFSVRLYEGKVYTDYAQSGSIYRQRKATTVLSTGQWYHIVATYDTSNANITEVYLNGVSDASSNITSGGTFTTTALMQSSSNISVGGGPTGTDGRIDQFRIFTKVLSASEVTTLYQENSLVASYRFEGNSNDDRRNFNGSDNDITYEYGLGFQPDLVWIKRRDGAENNYVQDSTRGSTKQIYTNLTNAEFNETGAITSFDTGGFTMGNYNGINNSGETYVAWCFKANGGTTSSNTDGTITSTVQANTDAGFSVVKYEGNGTSGASIGHGLSTSPEMIIVKNISQAVDWAVYNTSIGNANYLSLNNNWQSLAGGSHWNSTSPTSTVFTVGNAGATNDSSGINYIAYCFHSVDGFSKIGSYTGNGSDNGPIVETGFEPAFVIIKNTTTADNWVIFDNKRNTTNSRTNILAANLDAAEYSEAGAKIDFLSNGFKSVGTGGGGGSGQVNKNANSYIYWAIAADPDTEAPTVAKSFSTVAYTGDGTYPRASDGSDDVTLDFGFPPGLVWGKSRDDGTLLHVWVDRLRGNDKQISSNLSDAEATKTSPAYTFEGDTLVVTSNGNLNNNDPYVAWAWKADDNEPTIFGGPAKAVYKFEDNANDVTGNYNGTASNVSYSSSGKFNKAADFNGTNAGFSFSSSIYNNNQDHSQSFWLNADSYAADEMIYWGGDDNIRWNSNGTIKYRRYSLSNGSRDIDSSTVLSTGTWYHIVKTYSTTNGSKLYINGSLEGSNSSTANVDSTSGDYGVMYRVDNSSAYSDGKIDQLRIYNGAVSDIGVAALYNETASDNDDLTLGGPPETIISANANAGFSIVKYEGDGTSSARVPHGLSAAPEMVIVKELTDSGHNWRVNHKDLTSNYNLMLNLTSGEVAGPTNGYLSGGYIGTMSSTTFEVKSGSTGVEAINQTGDSYIAYCFHSVSNFNKIGTFTGTGTGTNQLINTGFQPDWVMFKDYSAGGSWIIVDSVRGGSKSVKANASDAESTTNYVTFESNGFRVAGDANATSSWVYAAFKIN